MLLLEHVNEESLKYRNVGMSILIKFDVKIEDFMKLRMH